MILLDTSVWVDHLRNGDPLVANLLETNQVLGHPLVVGEIALGRLVNRSEILALLANLAPAAIATHEETMFLIESHELWGRGIGLIDTQLLAATFLTPDTTLWTRDKRLHAVAIDLGCGYEES
ncbi:MAG: type II toxin-antitoxin system VapC family toxin [Acidimicrobiaceae bacterium]|nr:type II toxin-antitoxin system VapC family toxin [Acidimicrobiaceae bacterium]